MSNKSRWCLLSEKLKERHALWGSCSCCPDRARCFTVSFAKLIGRTPQQLAKLEKGENEPVLSTIVVIAHALEIDPCILFRKTVELMPSIPVIEEPEGSREQP
ncbi:MAG: helix-turn-helix domain-containing protein [Bilophila wadsworthia]